ncbi:probable RNA-binding protein EIF1AD [Saccostrea cucullata]|uniref:probable RNA-binding protein EIF1AD n=1 Tax=Saccostrea cuccullata TaxID=36930 RepID=UPI002ED2C7D7
MSKATKRKHVTKEVLDEFVLPTEDQQIVRVTAGRGNNLHEVETAQNERFLVSMPTRFRKNVWIKRGDYVLIEPIQEGEKVKAEIAAILYKEQIKYIQEEGKWPAEFVLKENNADEGIPADMLPPSDDEDEEGELTVVNANRRHIAVYEESEENSSEEEER